MRAGARQTVADAHPERAVGSSGTPNESNRICAPTRSRPTMATMVTTAGIEATLTPMQRGMLDAARTAPSAHNSQPWRFRPSPQGLELGWAADRELPHGDPTRRYLMAGLGAAAEAAALGAAREGRHGSVTWGFDPAARIVARIEATDDAPSSSELTLARTLPERATTRLPFGREETPAPALRAIVHEAEEAGCSMAVLTGASGLTRFADLVVEGTARNMADGAVYEEFHGWLRLGRRAATAVDGLTGPALGFGPVRGALSVPLMSTAAMRVWRATGVHRLLAGTQRRLARGCGSACLLVARSPEARSLFEGGRVMLRVWLAATAAGLRVHPMTAPLDHAETRGRLSDLFGLPSDAATVVCLRLGRGPAAPRSPRLSPAALLEPAVEPSAESKETR
jgi:nitroreductase